MIDIVKEIDEVYKFFKGQIETYFHDGEYWGVPIFTMVMLLTYRPNYLEKYVGTTELPKTWDELLECAKKCIDPPDVYGTGIAGAKNLMISEIAYIFLTNVGAKFFDEECNVIFNSPETIRAMRMYKGLFQYTPPGAKAWSWRDGNKYSCKDYSHGTILHRITETIP